jgi:probable rRNA maturation factor
LNELGSPESELSVSLVEDEHIQELNRRYLGRDKPTNVLAFAMREGEFPSLHPQILGDVVVSVDTAQRQSNRFGIRDHEMVLLLMIHGILHLVGYEHEGKAKGASEMARKQKELFQKIAPLI